MQWHQLDHTQTICTSLQTPAPHQSNIVICKIQHNEPFLHCHLAVFTVRSCQFTLAACAGANSIQIRRADIQSPPRQRTTVSGAAHLYC